MDWRSCEVRVRALEGMNEGTDGGCGERME